MPIGNCKTETKTTRLNLKDYLFYPTDKNIRVTICDEDISYDEWREKIHKSIGKILENCHKLEEIKIVTNDFSDCALATASTVSTIIYRHFTEPCNLRISIGSRTWVFILHPKTTFIGHFCSVDFNVRTSFFVNNTNDPYWLQEAKLLCKLSSILGQQLCNTKTPLTIWFYTAGKPICCSSIDSLIKKIKTEPFFMKDMRIDIDGKTWIIYIVETN